MTERKVYISSTYADYAEMREKLRQAITMDFHQWYKLGWIMEHMRSNGVNQSAIASCVEEVKKCDIYILIIGDRYGSETQHNGTLQSYTEHEYDAAVENKKASKFVIYASDKYVSPYGNCTANPQMKDKLDKFKLKARGNLRPMMYEKEEEIYNFFQTCLNIDIHKRLIKEKLGNSTTAKYLINRTSQDYKYEKFTNPALGLLRSVVPTFIFATVEDKPDFYSRKIWFSKFERNIDYNGRVQEKTSYEYKEDATNLLVLIQNTVTLFLNQKDENVLSIDDIVVHPNYKREQKIIEFIVPIEEFSLESSKWIKLITDFVNQIQAKFFSNKIKDRIYVIIRVIYKENKEKKKGERDISDLEMQKAIDAFHFISPDDGITPKIEVLNLKQLKKINVPLVKKWVFLNFNDSPSQRNVIIEQLSDDYYKGRQFSYREIVEEFLDELNYTV